MFLGDKNSRGVVAETAAKKIEAGKRNRKFVGTIGANRIDHLAHYLVGALQRRAIGQDHRADVIALIFVRHQRTRCDAPQADRQRHHSCKQE